MLATYGYDELGARASITRPNNAATTYVPDALKRLQQLSHDFAGTSSDMVAAFAYNPAGQVVARAVNNDAAYTWTPSTGTTVAQFDGRNQLADFAGTAVGSDANGNVSTGITNLTYTFDPQGQLRAATGGSGVEVDYEPTGMLSRMKVGGNSTDFLYDGADLVVVYDASGDVLARYVHGPALDEPLVIYTGPETGNKTWLHADERGSIVARSDASGAATATAKYSSDGEGSTISVFGYTGQLYLSQLQLYYYKARMYSPKTARFVQPDPIGYSDGMNLFAYVGNDPINSRDPFGLAAATDPQFCNSMGMCVPIAYGQLQSWDPCDFACRAHQESQNRAMFANAAGEFAMGFIPGYDLYSAYTNPDATGFDYVVGIAGIVPGWGKGVGLGLKAARGAGRVTTEFIDNVTVVSKGKVIGRGTVDVRATVEGIQSGKLSPRDIFRNDQGLLPSQRTGYYQEFYHPTPGFSGTGPERIIRGQGGELYYTPDHYRSFIPLN